MSVKIKDLILAEDQEGEVGLELEMEGNNLPTNINKYWRVEGDGSLRGGYEYVLQQPCKREDVEKQVSHLFESFKKHESDLNPTFRTSLHVHLNVQQWTVEEVFTFIVLYLILEDALVKWCGEGREGNLFCLRARDAEYVLDLIEDSARRGRIDTLRTDKIRYAAMNCNALYKYGSLEFRAMRGTDDPEAITKWVSMLLKVKDAAMSFKNAAQVVDGYSEGGEHYFCKEVLKEHFEELCSYPGWEDDVYQGIRRTQCIAYACRQEDDKENKKEKPMFNMEDVLKPVAAGIQRVRAKKVADPVFAGEWEAPDAPVMVEQEPEEEEEEGMEMGLGVEQRAEQHDRIMKQIAQNVERRKAEKKQRERKPKAKNVPKAQW